MTHTCDCGRHGRAARVALRVLHLVSLPLVGMIAFVVACCLARGCCGGMP